MISLDSTLALDVARMVHLLGLAMGFGLALWADVSALKCFFKPVTDADIRMMHRLHNTIMAGVLVLWASGLFLLYARTGFDLANFSPKLMLKLGVVTLLTVNGCFIAYFAIPQYAIHEGFRFGDIRFATRLKMGVIAGVSLCCWISALTLGVFSQLRPMDGAALQQIFLPIFAVGIGGVLSFTIVVPFCVAVGLRIARYRNRRMPADPVDGSFGPA
ncbi:hypothetical protein [Actibacterium sp. 188UL27-1]|uniref:hypothetical protein n=1 Tax=Actibacterium sp. 188UL27-1 TaxID=2786961 RepID=UPI00195E8908|nr:hypothetical protein [Actibacterium sp. 188UL27-1]MBM7069526.1 hypothetical protein [Actibacterium sp. 188UL27-1]